MLDGNSTPPWYGKPLEPSPFQRAREFIAEGERFRDIEELSKGPLKVISHDVRDRILFLLQQIEAGSITFEDPAHAEDVTKVLWGKAAYLNGQLGIKHPESAVRYGKHGGTPTYVEPSVHIFKS